MAGILHKNLQGTAVPKRRGRLGKKPPSALCERGQKRRLAARPAELRVDLGDRSYPIIIGTDVLDQAGAHLARVCRSGPCAIITNPVIRRLYGVRVWRSLRRAGFKPLFVEIPEGERFKSYSSLRCIHDALVVAKLERSSPLIALGGGVIGDLTGFAAATYLRGVPFVQIPTTLLAQVDSSVGGKTGINHPQGKNLIGAFHQPRLVLSDLRTLETLPRRELVAGLAEVIKYGAILDEELFGELEQNIESLIGLDYVVLQRVIRRSCELKAQVVQADEREAGHRAVLNFGHTLGHAVESLTNYRRYLHGEAVSIGMVFAARLSVLRCGCPEEDADRLRHLLRRTGLPVEMPGRIERGALAVTVAGDKKVRGGKIKFVCIKKLGETRFVELNGREIAELAIRFRDAREKGR